MPSIQHSSEIRKAFLNYFHSKQHEIVPSSSLIPFNDPTLLFTNAGMVQFKDVFLGHDPRPYKRAVSAQKCIRAGGKHNDLENVGFTARHHTFFEMLGNFSFGDYFKKDAIHFAWDFITNHLKISKERLYVTIFREDDESGKIWHEQEKVPINRIFRFDEKDNFWSMGETGPCGPCSEIFVDRGSEHGCQKPHCNVGCDCDRFMEIWNLVFMQFDRAANGRLTPLPKPSIDTGMGLERITAVLQNADSNYDTDLFQDIIQYTAELAKVEYHQNQKLDVALRVIADHCRAMHFLISDGVLPSNEGRGYVLRRIMRRAIRHGKTLGFQTPFLHQLTSPFLAKMSEPYPELRSKKEFLEKTILLEEERFLKTLENGLQILDQAISQAKSDHVIPGETAFKLYDTFGFPLDLTQLIAQEQGYQVNLVEFEAAMKAQQERSREHWKGSGEIATEEAFKNLQKEKIQTNFLGYHQLSMDGKALVLLQDGQSVQQTHASEFQVIIDQTPFYAEGGGQVADRGTLQSPDNSSFSAEVYDVQKPTGNFIVLYCKNAQGTLRVGDTVHQIVSESQRTDTAKNHTATHLLHAALRNILGTHVQQAGSLVTPDLLRFDFTHPQPLNADQLERVENQVNQEIRKAKAVIPKEMSKEAALQQGAIAFFEEKYGSTVRVISVGEGSSKSSTELCGGTHVENTIHIQMFKILNESGIAAGVRRIVAVTGQKVLEKMKEQTESIGSWMHLLKASAPQEIQQKITVLQNNEKDLRKKLERFQQKWLKTEIQQWLNQAQHSKDGLLVCGLLEDAGFSMKDLRDAVDLIRSVEPNTVCVLGSWENATQNAQLIIAVPKSLTPTIKAQDWVKNLAPLLEASGGGKPDFAQAGGKKNGFQKVFAEVKKLFSA